MTAEPERIAAIRQIVRDHTAAEVEGYLVDAFSANVILKVYDNVSPENKAKFLTLSLPRMSKLAFEVLK